jgi:hypothetical protein
MANWVLTINGTVIPRQTIQPLTNGEKSITNVVEEGNWMAFTAAITSKLGNYLTLPPKSSHPTIKDEFEYDLYADDNSTWIAIPEANVLDATGTPVIMQLLTDGLINAEVLLPIGDSQAMATVIGHAVDSNGNLIGEYDDNPMSNSLKYMCEFPDGAIKEYLAIVIASNIFAEADSNGNSSTLLYKIIDQKLSGKAVITCDKYITSKNRTKRIRQTTVG